MQGLVLEQRAKWELIGHGIGIQWPQIDEDIEVESLLAHVIGPTRRRVPLAAALGRQCLENVRKALASEDARQWHPYR